MMRLKSISAASETDSIVGELNEEEVPFHLEILTAGSWFLRLGCMVFGMIGISYYICEIYRCYRNTKCDAIATIILNLLSIIFLTMQGHFIFRNWKISKTKSILIAKFGTMHLVGANLWTWVRFVMVEESVMYKEVCLGFDKTASSSHVNLSDTHENIGEEGACKGGMESLLEGLTGLMYTSLVEYSLIGAAVMYIVWRNIKQKHGKKSHPEHKETPIQINLKHTLYGAIFGFMFVLGCIILMVLYFVYYDDELEYMSQYIFSVTNCIQYIIAGVTCLIALYQMRVLVYIDIPENEQEDEEESQVYTPTSQP
uniref:Uncharacterized protein n=1 Tax=Acrobeloides nanus TaxID=290746 RepID=A0A914D611_9BILA